MAKPPYRYEDQPNRWGMAMVALIGANLVALALALVMGLATFVKWAGSSTKTL